MSLPQKHFNKTKELLDKIDKSKIADWLLNEGYFPEQYVLPPSFQTTDFELKNEPYNSDLSDLARRDLISISYPKTLLTSRNFAIQDPRNYHDIVYWMMDDWSLILDKLFHDELKIYPYSFPIPVTARSSGALSPLRSGRMIYEWLEMAEKDMIAEASEYNLIIRTDIKNFYNSIYTHSIAWALHGREKALQDIGSYNLVGNKIDRLVQYANDARTNGIPVGSALSDLIAEIVLTSIDRKVSNELEDINFLGTRFKDDYRILCNSKEDAKTILRALSEELNQFNLLLNEKKTHILELPEGLYRKHDREYFPHSLKGKEKISFKEFELTLLNALDIHREYPGTSLLEKFLNELFDNDYNLKIEFSNNTKTQRKQLIKTISLMIMLKRESEKTLCHVLAIIEVIFNKYGRKHDLKEYLQELFYKEIADASDRDSVFELVWIVFFSRFAGIGLVKFKDKIDDELMENLFLKTIIASQQKIFPGSHIDLFTKPKDCRDNKLAKIVAAFEREK